MSGLSKKIITIAAIIVFFGGAIVYTVLKSHRVYVPDNVVGNTAGNLLNNGLFCESDGKVYFSNPYCNGAICVMNPDQTDIKLLDNMSAKYINAGGGYLFFYGEPQAQSKGLGTVVGKPGLFMMDADGKNLTKLTKNVAQNCVLGGNNVYFLQYSNAEGATFAKVNLSNRTTTKLLDYMINPVNFHDGSIYFNGQQRDHHLYAYNTVTDTVETVWEGDIWNPIYNGDYVYYMDVQNDYRLCRYSIRDNTIEVLTRERLDFYNLYGGVIYYQVSNAAKPALKRMNADGTQIETVAQGVFKDVSITSKYVYFTQFGADYPIYCTPTFSAVNVTEFQPPVTLTLK